MTTPTRRATEKITVAIPMAFCGMELSKNGRVHWRVRHRAFQDQKDWCVHSLWNRPEIIGPWPAAIMDVHWMYSRGRAPDDTNVWARVDPCRDAFESALVVLDDKHIRTGQVTFQKVKTGDECVLVTLTREER